VLKNIDAWVKAGAQGGSIFWLHGPAGAGKSAIAQAVAERCAGRNQLAASFFFARTAAHRNEAKYLFPTIAVQLALSAPEKRQSLDKILNSDPYIAERALGSVELLVSLLEDRFVQAPQASSPFLVIIDGLDECQRNNDQCWILAQVFRMLHTHNLPLRFLIVSRPEPHLMEIFGELEVSSTFVDRPAYLLSLAHAQVTAFSPEPAVLLDRSPQHQGPANIMKVLSLDGGAYSDVLMYLRSEFSRIYGAERHRGFMESVPQPWPSEDIIERLVGKSRGYFIYPSTVIRFINEEYFSPVARLDQVFGTSDSFTILEESNPLAELDRLYNQILLSYSTSQLPVLKSILGYVVMSPVFSNRGMYLPFIGIILGLSPEQMELTLRGLRSLVSFDLQSKEPHLFDASFGDFLLDRERANDFHIDSEEWICTTFHHAFSLACESFVPHNGASQPLQGRS